MITGRKAPKKLGSRLLITVSIARDLDRFRAISSHLLERLWADTNVLVVPVADVDIFRRNVDERWVILPETEVLKRVPGLDLETLSERAGDRYGWYAQQFAKLGGLMLGSNFDEVLIWDSDTLPLRRPVFRDSAGRLLFYSSDEYNPAYFDQILRFLGIPKAAKRSFIAQCMLVPVEWSSALLRHIEALHGDHWGKNLLDSIDFSETYGFSEFELLGCFFVHFFPTETRFSYRNWTRNGTLHFGSPRWLPPHFLLALVWDFMSFESWQPPRWRRFTLWLERK